MENCKARTRKPKGLLVPLTEDQAELASRWFGFVLKRADERSRGYEQAVVDRCRDYATDALMDAARTDDPSLDLKFSTHLGNRLGYALTDAISGKRVGKRGNPKFSGGPADEYDVADHREPDRDSREQAEGVISGLRAEEQNVIEDYYFCGLTDREIADSRGMTRDWVCKLRLRAIAHLRAANGVDEKPKRKRRTREEMAASA